MSRVLVTGSEGQLGKCLQRTFIEYPEIHCTFLGKSELDITNSEAVAKAFSRSHYDYCINTAAYNHVEEAEKHPSDAYDVNAYGVELLSKACKENNTCLIHISTDYVFDGKKTSPYLSTDTPNPINAYGKSKLEGEKQVLMHLDRYFIIRTSWLYSEFGANFVKFIIGKIQDDQIINVVNDQKGSPTYGGDLATFLAGLIYGKHSEYGIYHFCNRGYTTWFDLAKQIALEMKISSKIRSINSDTYDSLTRRPSYSVLSTDKTEKTFKHTIPTWQQSLSGTLARLSQSP